MWRSRRPVASVSQHAPPRRRSRLEAAASPRANARPGGRLRLWLAWPRRSALVLCTQARMAGWRRSPSTRRASSRTRRRPHGVVPHGQMRPRAERAPGGGPALRASVGPRASERLGQSERLWAGLIVNKPTTTRATPLPKHRPTGHAEQITAQQEPGPPGNRGSTPGRRRADRRSAERR